MCYWEFQDHGPNLDHWLVKNLRPNWTAKIPLEAFEKSTVKASDKHETKDDEASADRKYNVDDTLFKSGKEVTEKEGASYDNLKNAYGANNVQTSITGSYCEKCEATFKSKKSFRRHLTKSHETNAYDIIYICL